MALRVDDASNLRGLKRVALTGRLHELPDEPDRKITAMEGASARMNGVSSIQNRHGMPCQAVRKLGL